MVGILHHYGLDVNLTDRWRTVLCPFHEEDHPSARASLAGFACLACGVRGDGIKLIMERERVDFSRAVELYEEWTGDGFKRVSKPTRRKSWGIPPLGEGSDSGDDRVIQDGFRKLPDLWG